MNPRLSLCPRVAPPNQLRVWVGAFDFRSMPALTWRPEGNQVPPAATPVVIRPLTPACPTGDSSPG